ncbi:hypothetical protein ACFPMF_01850 [Larkinella bovis]|uniref:Uncharacterized protein n=1 Tax=Larkinella bovis TaxID=683041 RepID=A0ABW0I617_9BACT
MITEQDIQEAGFVPYQYVWIDEKINRETGKYDRKRITRHDIFVHPGTSLNSNKSMPDGPYILMDVSRQYGMQDGKMVETSKQIRYEGKHGALGFQLKTVQQLINFKSYIETPTII